MISKKVAMLGSWGVGKTSLVRQYIHSVFEEKYLSTLGVKVDKKDVDVGSETINMMLWDIAGSEDKFSVPMHYVRGAAGYILVIDGTRKESLASAVELADKVRSDIGPIPFIVLANKSDLEWQITGQQIEAAFQGLDLTWLATSAKTGENVENAFSALAEKLLASH